MNKILLLLPLCLLACASKPVDPSDPSQSSVVELPDWSTLSDNLFPTKEGTISILACLESGGDIGLSPEDGKGLCLFPDKESIPVNGL